MGLIIHIDGGARGNPGPAGAGVVIRTEKGAPVHEAGYFLGRQTNNAAEYHALIRALQRAQRAAPDALTIYSDSELLVRQLTGDYQVKSPGLAPLFREAQTLLLRIGRWNVRHVRREENTRADELANMAMDRRADVVVFDVDGAAAGVGPAQPAAPPPRRGAVKRTASRQGVEAAAVGPFFSPATADARAVHVDIVRQPGPGTCPAGGFTVDEFTVAAALPAGLCIHAAHALVPTLLAMLNTEPEEFAAIPAVTVRCGRPGCGAEFKLSPVQSANGHRAEPH
ncbi:MAG: ribonuclease HI family protein [Planctomycetota bacterium]